MLPCCALRPVSRFVDWSAGNKVNEHVEHVHVVVNACNWRYLLRTNTGACMVTVCYEL